MSTMAKLMWLEFIGGVCGWGWIIFGVLMIFSLIKALAFGGTWSSVFLMFGGSSICKWLARGFLDNQRRITYESKLVEQGYTPEEAASKCFEEYSKGRL